MKGRPVDTTYDTIVIGLGAMGSATLYYLAQRGQRALGIEQFEPAHNQGSTHGPHRLIRTSTLAGDAYVPLADRALTLWQELADVSGVDLVHMNGEVRILDPVADPNAARIADAMVAQGFQTWLSPEDLAERFPGVRPGEGMRVTWEERAGYIRCEQGVLTHLDQARRHGAQVRSSEPVTGFTPDGAGWQVNTVKGSYRAGRVIVTTGPWAAEFLGDLGFPMQVERRVNAYFRPTRPDWWSEEAGAPNFLLDVPEGDFYGMPATGDLGVKIGVSAGSVTTPRTINRTIAPEEMAFFRDVLDRYLPGASGEVVGQSTCMCTYTVDSDFIVDHHPHQPGVILGCGFSGRGFKFAPVIGEILADLATNGETGHDIAFLSAGRFAERAVAVS
jgi:sarcosine oxidase